MSPSTSEPTTPHTPEEKHPYGLDPDKCIWEVYSMQRYPEGQEPKVEQEWSMDHSDKEFWGLILTQDYSNMAEVQKGMKSRAFKGARPNPKQEAAVINFHRALGHFLDNGYGA